MIKKLFTYIFLIITMIGFVVMGLTFRDGKFSFNMKIIEMFRMPEMVMLIVGTIGAVISTYAIHQITKNKTADIGIVGLNSANYLSVTIIYAFTSVSFFLQVKDLVMPIIYFASSVGILLVIYILTFKYGESGAKIIIIGVVFSLTISAITNMIISNLEHTKQEYLFNFGLGQIHIENNALFKRSSIMIYSLISLALVLYILHAKKIKIVYTDPNKAKSIGINIKYIRAILFIISALGASASFSALGPLSFIGFISTNMIYIFIKRTGIEQLLLSLIIGIILMSIVYISKHWFIPPNVPIGIVTNIIAAPYLAVVIWKGNKNDR